MAGSDLWCEWPQTGGDEGESIPGEMMSTIAVVIVNYNRCNDLRDGLTSVYKQDRAPDEVIVVDNASTDNSVEMLRREFPRVKIHQSGENLGMEGYSVACKLSDCDFVFQMDNDSLMPDSSVLSSVLREFEAAPSNVAILATRVEEVRGDISQIEVVRNADSRVGLLNTIGYHAGGVAFRKKLMDQVGYYNRDVFLYGAELFVQLQAIAGGFELRYAPAIFMVHRGSPVARTGKAVYYEIRNRYWCIRHFGSPLQSLYYLPQMIIHDLLYSIRKHALGTWFTAVRHGLSKLPSSLHPPMNRNSLALREAVAAVGKGAGFWAAVSRGLGQLRS